MQKRQRWERRTPVVHKRNGNVFLTPTVALLLFLLLLVLLPSSSVPLSASSVVAFLEQYECFGLHSLVRSLLLDDYHGIIILLYRVAMFLITRRGEWSYFLFSPELVQCNSLTHWSPRTLMENLIWCPRNSPTCMDLNWSRLMPKSEIYVSKRAPIAFVERSCHYCSITITVRSSKVWLNVLECSTTGLSRRFR